MSPFRVNPTFERYPNEARWIGRILAAFGEIEVTTCMLSAASLRKTNQVLRALYRIRMTSARLEAADGLARPEFATHGLLDDYVVWQTMVMRCLSIRNRYAHCNWGDHPRAGLFSRIYKMRQPRTKDSISICRGSRWTGIAIWRGNLEQRWEQFHRPCVG
jgi:hypothetical protein